ncbi:MAG TPA: biotin/lipoyl-binding protein, partial [Candidatus Dormibacteraeota bacterium]
MRRLRERRLAIPAVIALLICLVVGIAIARSGAPAIEFRTAKAALGTVTQTVDITGTLQPSSETDLDFGSNGHVQTIGVQAGQTVAAGTVLASLDPTDAQTQLKNAQIALQSAGAKLAQDAPGSTNVQQQIAVSQVNNARPLIGGARNNVIDTQQLGQQTVTGSQIALQTALAAAQGLITQDQQAVVALQAQLNDTTRTDQQAISVAAASLRQTQAQVQGTLNVDQANLATAQRNLSAQHNVDQAAINSAQALVNGQQQAVNAAESCVPNPPTTTCPNVDQAKAQLQIDQADLQQAQAKAQQNQVLG